MIYEAVAAMEMKSWTEVDLNLLEGAPKLSHARMTASYSGEMAGEGSAEFLITTRDDGTASFVSLERVAGRLGERSGSFVLQGSGTWADSTVVGTWSVVPGSGTGELAGLSGEGSYVAPHGAPGQVTLRYAVEG